MIIDNINFIEEKRKKERERKGRGDLFVFLVYKREETNGLLYSNNFPCVSTQVKKKKILFSNANYCISFVSF